MPVETIKCQECGSAEVTEYKAGSYVCSHCDAIFKHVDPTRVTVAPAFCTCGNRIVFRCDLCQSGLCGECDVKRLDFVSLPMTFVHMQGFGYLLRRTETCYSIGKNRWVHEFAATQRVFGPVLSAVELLWALPERGESAPHLCWGCVVATAPIVVDAVSRGTICEAPTCIRTPDNHCRCCNAALCDYHMDSGGGVGGGGDSPYIRYPDVCPNCRYEHMQRVRDAHPIPEVLPGRTNRATRRAWNKWYAEKDRVFDQLEKEMSAELYALHTQGPCERVRHFDEGLPGGGKFGGYRVLDERPSTTAAPLSSVTASP
jgi:hypothetical protein